MICNIRKIIRIAVVTSVLLICGNEAHAFGFPILFKTYLADAMRTWTVTAMSRAQTAQEHNNIKLVEEAIERGNFLEVALLYETMRSGDWDEFGNDPFGYVKDAAEKAMKKEANEYIKKAQEEEKKYLEEKLKGKDKDKDKDKDNQGGEGQGQSQNGNQNQSQSSGQDQSQNQSQGSGQDKNYGTDIQPDLKAQAAAKKRDEAYKQQIFNWYKNTRSVLGHATTNNGAGLLDDMGNIIPQKSKSDENKEDSSSERDKEGSSSKQ